MEANKHGNLALVAATAAVDVLRRRLQPRAGCYSKEKYRVHFDGHETDLCRCATDAKAATVGDRAGRASWACPVKKTQGRANGSLGA